MGYLKEIKLGSLSLRQAVLNTHGTLLFLVFASKCFGRRNINLPRFMLLLSAVKATVALSCSIEVSTINMTEIKMSQDALLH